MFVLWAVSLNYKVVYDRGAASVCVSKLRGQRRVAKPPLQRVKCGTH